MLKRNQIQQSITTLLKNPHFISSVYVTYFAAYYTNNQLLMLKTEQIQETWILRSTINKVLQRIV